jgi:hypothetical protein
LWNLLQIGKHVLRPTVELRQEVLRKLRGQLWCTLDLWFTTSVVNPCTRAWPVQGLAL